jgi:hypothetical protein
MKVVEIRGLLMIRHLTLTTQWVTWWETTERTAPDMSTDTAQMNNDKT